MHLGDIRKELAAAANEEKATVLRRFFKTGPGEYGEGDRFLGIQVPILRKFAKRYRLITLDAVEQLLQSAIHEERLLALLILILQYQARDLPRQQAIFDLYLRNAAFINNWDLVDLSADKIVGSHLFERSREVLYKLAESELLWERRIAIIATFHFIKRGEFTDTLGIADLLLDDREDLIQKAVGWMLREVGKRNLELEQEFLRGRYRSMPRTMLRYAIERFPEELRRQYLRGAI